VITKSITKFFAACLVFTAFSSPILACIPALVIVKNMETNGDYAYDSTSSGGRAHAAAYRDNLSSLLIDKGYCRLGKYLSFGPVPIGGDSIAEANAIHASPYFAPLDYALHYNPEMVFTMDRKKYALPSGEYDWSNPVVLKSLLAPESWASSTLMILHEKDIWGANGINSKDDVAGLMKNIIDYDKSTANYTNLRYIGYPMPYNQAYVLSNQDPVDHRFNTVEAYLQLYKIYDFDQSVDSCYFRVPSNVSALKITKLVKIEYNATDFPDSDPSTYYPEFITKYNCDY